MKYINDLRGPNSSQLIHDPSKLPTILNQHFATCGLALAAQLPHSERYYSDYLGPINHINSFFFNPLTSDEIESKISLLPMGKSHEVYFCPTRIFKIAKSVISTLLKEITNDSILQGTYPGKLKLVKVVPVYKNDDATDPNNYRPISLLSILNRIFEKLVYKRLK